MRQLSDALSPGKLSRTYPVVREVVNGFLHERYQKHKCQNTFP